MTKEFFPFQKKITPLQAKFPMEKSLYEQEGEMNEFERLVISELSALENVVFWHRNLEKGKGFALNGYKSNHYPDFILYTKNSVLILLETKGDYLDNEESREKNDLGKKWAELAGQNYKYFMVFDKKQVENCYTKHSIKEIIREL